MGRNPGGKMHISNRRIAVARGKKQKRGKIDGRILEAGEDYFRSLRESEGAALGVASSIWDSMSVQERTAFCIKNAREIAIRARKKQWKEAHPGQTRYGQGSSRYF
ncbi:MAG: hypothetical protein V1493_01365 [Candidatus Diapherotrites archaeon]